MFRSRCVASLTRAAWLVLMLAFSGQLPAQEAHVRWMAVGDLHSWFRKGGCEPEVSRRMMVSDQIDGLRWPAQYRWQDTQAAKSLWIGAKDYDDLVAGTVYPFKVVHAGPRSWDDENEFMPLEFTLIGRFERPEVLVDGAPASALGEKENLDELDANLKADRMIRNRVRTSMGIEMTRNIYAFSQQYHSNYFIYEYIFKNTGIVDTSGTLHPQPLDSVYFHWQYRYAVCREMSAYGLFVMPQSCTWGHNTMNDARGEDPAAGDPFRALFAWHGRHSQAGFDNIGAPNVDEDGRLLASQHVGVVTLHADTAPDNPTDDLFQPRTTQYLDSDSPINSNNDPYNPTRMALEFTAMSAGHPAQRHADAVGDCPTCYANLFNNTGGGYSGAHGFGPYSLQSGDSIRIVLAEAVAGLDRDKNIEVGGNWFYQTPPYILPDGSTTGDRDEYKNAWVYTGRDSLFQTFARAAGNYASGFNIPQPPPPPAWFEVSSGEMFIDLSWSNNVESWPGFLGYRIYRAENQPDTEYSLIFECDTLNLVNSYQDDTAQPGLDYYYYIVSYDDGAANNIQTQVPLVSSKFYTMTALPARITPFGLDDPEKGHAVNEFRLDVNYPNPFNPETQIAYHLPRSVAVQLTIYNVLGQKVRTLVDATQPPGSYTVRWDGKDALGNPAASGIYIYTLTAGEFRDSRKMTLLR